MPRLPPHPTVQDLIDYATELGLRPDEVRLNATLEAEIVLDKEGMRVRIYSPGERLIERRRSAAQRVDDFARSLKKRKQ